MYFVYYAVVKMQHSKYHSTSHHSEKTEAGQLIKTKNAISNSTEGNKDISRWGSGGAFDEFTTKMFRILIAR